MPNKERLEEIIQPNSDKSFLVERKASAVNLGFVCELGFGGEGKAYGEINPCLRVLKKQGKGFGGFRRASFVEFSSSPKLEDFGGLNIQIGNFALIIIQNFNFRHTELLRSLSKTTYSYKTA